MIIQIDSGYFCAAVFLKAGYVNYYAPILHYMRGWTQDQVTEYATRKKWKYILLPED
jgi:hypothetical protein